MIDRDLRRTFVAHERLTPDAAAVASRIAVGIRRRRRRVRVAALTAAAAAALALGGAIPVVVSRTSMEPVEPAVPTPSAPSPSTSPDSDGLMPAPPIEVVIPMSPGWLPEEVLSPTYTFTDANLTDGSRTLTYEARPEVTGVESVSVITRTQAPEVTDPAADGGYPSWVSTHETRTVEVRGQQAHETVVTSVSVGARSCMISWMEPAGLFVMTVVTEKTTSTETTCDVGERFARELRAEPLHLERTVSLGLVPVGYELVATGTNRETWCPHGRVQGGCIDIQDGQNYDAPENSTPVTVRGQQGYLGRDYGVLLLVPGFVRLSIEPGVPASVDTTDAGLVRLAESAVLDRSGW